MYKKYDDKDFLRIKQYLLKVKLMYENQNICDIEG